MTLLRTADAILDCGFVHTSVHRSLIVKSHCGIELVTRPDDFLDQDPAPVRSSDGRHGETEADVSAHPRQRPASTTTHGNGNKRKGSVPVQSSSICQKWFFTFSQ